MYFQRLRDLREDRDLRQQDIAELLHTSQTVYSRYERGISNHSGFAFIDSSLTFIQTSTDYLLRTHQHSNTLPEKVKAQNRNARSRAFFLFLRLFPDWLLIEASAIAGVAGRSLRDAAIDERIIITVGQNLTDKNEIAGGLALVPQLLTATGKKPSGSCFHRVCQCLLVCIAQHENFIVPLILTDDRNQLSFLKNLSKFIEFPHSLTGMFLPFRYSFTCGTVSSP